MPAHQVSTQSILTICLKLESPKQKAERNTPGETAGGQDRGIWVKDVGVRRADMRGSLSFQYSAQGGQVTEERRAFPAIGPARKTSGAGWVGKSGLECYLEWLPPSRRGAVPRHACLPATWGKGVALPACQATAFEPSAASQNKYQRAQLYPDQVLRAPEPPRPPLPSLWLLRRRRGR